MMMMSLFFIVPEFMSELTMRDMNIKYGFLLATQMRIDLLSYHMHGWPNVGIISAQTVVHVQCVRMCEVKKAKKLCV